jgi:hypothetical protein
MPSRLRRLLAGFAASVVTAATLVLITSPPASAAFGDENYGCRVSPGSDFTYRSYCTNNRASSTYHVAFVVENTSPAAGYSYDWSISGEYLYIINNGCTATSFACGLAMRANQSATVEVTYTQNGQSITKWASTYLAPYCGQYPC